MPHVQSFLYLRVDRFIGEIVYASQMSIEVVDHKVLRVRMKSEINLKKKNHRSARRFFFMKGDSYATCLTTFRTLHVRKCFYN